MSTKPNVSRLIRKLREAADELEQYDSHEPRRPSKEVWNVLTHALLVEDTEPDTSQREMAVFRLVNAVKKYKESERNGVIDNGV